VTAVVLRLALATAVLLIAGSFAFDRWTEHERAAERRALDARMVELMTRATAPGSALACLDALAGDAVEIACENALFASPEAVAAAVSYVAAQLTLLSAGRDLASRTEGQALAQLRRAAAIDRFGIVAHILATRDGCTAAQCSAFGLLDDASRVGVNIAEGTFDAHVKRHAAAWPSDAGRAVAAASAGNGPSPAAVAGGRSPNNLFFPSAASIPPVSIMNSEPGGTAPQDTTGSAEAKTARKPAQPVPHPRPAPNNANANASPAAPLPLAPNAQ
jgi:hypothetical protein